MIKQNINLDINEVNQMAILDQELRNAVDPDWNKIDEIDKKHTSRLKLILAEFGFPKISKFGKTLNHNFWLIVQHSPDHEFMKSYLTLMKNQHKDDYDFKDYAYLLDRVLMHDKKPQIYGTQLYLNEKSKKFELWEVEDFPNLDERRLKIGLTSIAEYLKSF